MTEVTIFLTAEEIADSTVVKQSPRTVIVKLGGCSTDPHLVFGIEDFKEFREMLVNADV